MGGCEGVDSDGLDATERRYVAELERARGPLALATLAARLDVSEEALRRVHELWLLRRGLVQITPAGRLRAPPAQDG